MSEPDLSRAVSLEQLGWHHMRISLFDLAQQIDEDAKLNLEEARRCEKRGKHNMALRRDAFAQAKSFDADLIRAFCDAHPDLKVPPKPGN